MTITVAGQIFKAYSCHRCAGFRDTDAARLEQHQGWHDDQDAKCKGLEIYSKDYEAVLCKVKGCDRWAAARAMCQMHYQREYTLLRRNRS
jgi:hypothetical protein